MLTTILVADRVVAVSNAELTHTGGFIHLLLVLAIAVVLIRVIRPPVGLTGRKTSLAVSPPLKGAEPVSPSVLILHRIVTCRYAFNSSKPSARARRGRRVHGDRLVEDGDQQGATALG